MSMVEEEGRSLLPISAKQAQEERYPYQDQDRTSDGREENRVTTDAAQEGAGTIHQEADQQKRYSLAHRKGQHHDHPLQQQLRSDSSQHQDGAQNRAGTGRPARPKGQADESGAPSG